MEKKYSINVVEGFNPYNYLVPMRDEITGEVITTEKGAPKRYLPASAKKVWFKLACPNGCVLTTEIVRDDGQYEFVARVYADKADTALASLEAPNAGAMGVGYALRTPAKNEKYRPFESAQTLAEARALEDAGFGSEVSLHLLMEEAESGEWDMPEKEPEPELPSAPVKPSFEVKTADTAVSDEEALSLFEELGVKGAKKKAASKKKSKKKAEESEPEAETASVPAKAAEPAVEVKPEPEASEPAAEAGPVAEPAEAEPFTPEEYVITATDVKGVAVLNGFIGQSLGALGKDNIKSILELAGDKISDSFHEAAVKFTEEVA